MNRTAVKNFAQWARRHLHDLVRARLALFGVTDKGIETPQRIQGGLIVGGQTLSLSATDIGQYDALTRHLHELSGTPKDKFALLVDEIAYTWFNRLAALRFMEVRGYAERALSSDTPGQPDPNLLRDAMTLAAQDDLKGVTPDTLAEWQRLYQPGEVYRRLLVAHAAAFETVMPFLFSREKAWLDLFLPDTLLNQDSIVRRMVDSIPEKDWQDIEIVGWLYQFYISERKDEVFAQKGKYSPRDIPAATQLFTPHWIVRYMVENSLGRVWLEAHPDSRLRDHMPYYLESENPAPPPNPELTPESLSVMDPACGSGHILVYAFDLLAHIYRERGYAERDIPALILEHNLHGLDIDERAAQLASFAVVMKARDLNSRLFRRDMPALNILQVRPTRGLALPNAGGRDMLGHYSTLSGGLNDADTLNPNDWQPLLDAFADADHLGSLITPPAFDAARLRAQLRWLEERGGLDAGALDDLRHLLKQAELLVRKYDAVVANPPYMGSSTFGNIVKTFAERNYSNAKHDLYAIFLIRGLSLVKRKHYLSMILMETWMFLTSFEKLRSEFFHSNLLSSLIHMPYEGRGTTSLGINFGTSAFVAQNTSSKGESTQFYNLRYNEIDDNGAPIIYPPINERYSFRNILDLKSVNGWPLAYWINDPELQAFKNMKPLSHFATPKQGLSTTNNDRFLRYWQEVNMERVYFLARNVTEAGRLSDKWFPFNKGGSRRPWYGNNEYIVNWQYNGTEIKQNIIDKYPYLNGNPGFVAKNSEYYFREGITWSALTSGKLSMRMHEKGFIFSDKGQALFSEGIDTKILLAFLNSRVASDLLECLSPTMDFHSGYIAKIPIDINFSNNLSTGAVSISKTDWDNFETSWDFIL